MNTDNSSANGNNGNRGRFTDRLKKMRRDRKRKIHHDEEENIVKRGGRNIFKVILAIPSVVYTNIKSNKKDSESLLLNEKVITIDQENHKIDRVKMINETDKLHSIHKSGNTDIVIDKNKERKIKVNKIRDIDVNLLKKKKELYLKDLERNGIVVREDITRTVDVEDRIKKLQKEILDLIKKKLVKNINELEILQSELYVLKELDSEDIYLKKCQEDIKEIKKLLSKIKSLKEKYDYLKDNVDFEYMLEYGDDLLIDKILELKELCSRDDIKYTVDNYKILDEYKFLYLKIDKLQDDTIEYDGYKNQKVEELKKRDIDFDKLKSDVYDIDRDKERYECFVKEQELFLKDLDDKISHIDSHEQVSYRLKGFNKLLGNSFKYLGLLLVNPLKGLIPGIATQTLVTRNLIHNLYNNLEWEENRRMVYDAIDYSMSINIAINNLDDTSSLVDSTLREILELKSKYMKEFSQYESSVYGYKDAIQKINKMENAVLGSKIKIDLMKQRMKEKEKQNNNKLKMVKKLNSSSNS